MDEKMPGPGDEAKRPREEILIPEVETDTPIRVQWVEDPNPLPNMPLVTPDGEAIAFWLMTGR
jgi:hypothetical protein